MIDRRADDRQAEGDVYAGVERKHLEWNVSLVVIERNNSIESFALGRRKGGIGNERAFNLNTKFARRFHRGLDQDFLFTIAEKPVLAGVRIQTASAQARFALQNL